MVSISNIHHHHRLILSFIAIAVLGFKRVNVKLKTTHLASSLSTHKEPLWGNNQVVIFRNNYALIKMSGDMNCNSLH